MTPTRVATTVNIEKEKVDKLEAEFSEGVFSSNKIDI